MNFDLVITNGDVVDGTGRRRFRADVGLREGKIAAVSTDGPLHGRQTLDATGLVIAPGFIDIHSHADWILPLPDHGQILAPLVLQGITTLVTGQCGFSPAPVTDASIPLVNHASEALRERAFPYRWRSVAGFLEALERGGLLLNAAFLVGHGTLRRAELGDSTAPPSPAQMEALRYHTRQALRDGAFGLSAGLAYDPGVFAKTDQSVEKTS